MVVLAFDLDEVLGQYLISFLEFHKAKHGSDYQLSQFYTYQFEKVTNQSIPDMIVDIEDFHKLNDVPWTPSVIDITVVPGALEGLTELKEAGFEMHVVTSRQCTIEKETNEWLNKHFPGIFTGVHVLNHFGGVGESRGTKLDRCREINAVILVDDSPGHTKLMSEGGKKAIIFDWDLKYGWSKFPDGEPENVKRITTWPDLVKELKTLK